MGFVRFYKTRLSPIVVCVALIVGIHVSWWSIQQNRALVPSSDRRQRLLGFRIPYLSPPRTDDRERFTDEKKQD